MAQQNPQAAGSGTKEVAKIEVILQANGGVHMEATLGGRFNCSYASLKARDVPAEVGLLLGELRSEATMNGLRTGAIKAAGSGTQIPHATTTPPATGQRWAEANGIYAGAVAYPDGRIVGLAWANDIADLPRQPWSKYGQDIAGARSHHDGRANTLAMAAAGCSIAQQVLALDPTAWIPSRIEALQLFTALGAAQTPANAIWTSTQSSGNLAFIQSFEGGNSGWSGKDDDYRVRAVRGFVLHHLNPSTLGAASAAPVENFSALEGGAA